MERLGFVLVYLGAGYGLVALGWAARVLMRSVPKSAARREELLLVAGASLVTSSLWLSWVEGWTPAGDFVVWSGWVALDPVSTGMLALLTAAAVGLVAVPARGGSGRATALAGLGGSVAALAAGNVIIQLATTRGSGLRFGGYLAAVGALVAVAGAALVLKGRGRRGGTERPVAGTVR